MKYRDFILDKLSKSKFDEAIEEWENHRNFKGKCDLCRKSKIKDKRILCANTLQSYLLAQSLNGEDEFRKLCFEQTKKLDKWITEQIESKADAFLECSVMKAL